MTEVKERIKVYHEKAKELFRKTAKQKAKEIGFEKRERKISGSLFLMSLICTVYTYGKITLSNLSSVARQIDKKCDASEQAFDKKFTKKALEYLQTMFAIVMRENVPGANAIIPLISAFTAVYVLDSTTVSLPESLKEKFPGCGGSASEAATKVYLLLDWLSGRYESIKIMVGIKADQDMGKHFTRGKKPNSLWLMDLGFWNLALFSTIKRMGSYFISRLHGQTSLYIKEKKLVKFDLDKFLAKAPRNRFFELLVYLGVEEKLPTRLIVVPVPKKAADERRRKLKQDYQKKGKTPSQKTLNRLDWNIFVTNVDANILPTSTIPIVYKIRWQVELTFKLAKSDAQLDHTLSQKPNRVLCEFYARLIALVTFNRLLNVLPQNLLHRISYPKSWQKFKLEAICFFKYLSFNKFVYFTQDFLSYLQKRAKINKRLKSPNTIDLLALASQNPISCFLLHPLALLAAIDSNSFSIDSFFTYDNSFNFYSLAA
jgi:hypothetical protein